MKVLRVFVVAVVLTAVSAAPAAAAPWVAPSIIGPDGGIVPRVAMNAAGQAVATWEAPFAGDGGIVVATMEPLGTFALPVTIGSGQSPDVAIGSGGDAVVVWTSHGSAVHAAVRAPGGMFGPEQSLEPAAPGDYCLAGLDAAVAPDGTAVVAWVDNAGCNSDPNRAHDVRIAWRAPGGQFGEPQTIATYRSGGLDAHVTIDSSDRATVVWAGAADPNAVIGDGGRSPAWGVWAATGDATGLGTPADLTGGAEHLSPGAAPEIDLAGNDRGDTVAVWSQPWSYASGGAVPDSGIGHGLIASIKPAGATWSQAAVVQDTGPGNAATPDVAIDERGNAAAAWNDACKMAFTYAPAGGAFGASVTTGCGKFEEGGPIQDGKAGGSHPVVGIDSAGRAVMSYGSDRGDPSVAPLETIRYTPGQPHELPYGISGPDGSHNIAPAIAFDGHGNGIVVWEGDDKPQPGVPYDKVRQIRVAQYDSSPPVVQCLETPTAAKPIAVLGLNEPAKIGVTVTRKTTCRRGHKRVACYRATGSKTANGVVGSNTVRLAHRLVKSAGAYKVQMAATDRAGNARHRTVTFRVR